MLWVLVKAFITDHPLPPTVGHPATRLLFNCFWIDVVILMSFLSRVTYFFGGGNEKEKKQQRQQHSYTTVHSFQVNRAAPAIFLQSDLPKTAMCLTNMMIIIINMMIMMGLMLTTEGEPNRASQGETNALPLTPLLQNIGRNIIIRVCPGSLAG